MRASNLKRWVIIFFLGGVVVSTSARTGRYRCMWREDPATSMVIGWDQITGADPILYYDTQNHQGNLTAYRFRQAPDRVQISRGMANHFVRLRNLRPNTVYHFVIADSEGRSQQLSFRTLPATSSERLSIIAGGDSRNYRDARRNANKLVRKLRPHFVMFAGDFTGGDTAGEWQDWLDDWQETIGSDGRLFPIVAAQGNHEITSVSLIDIFDIPNDKAYYALSFGGNLLRVYTLNTLTATGGEQADWLKSDLQKHQSHTWKVAQYHHPIRPHTAGKGERDELLYNWAPLFYRYGVRLVVECDAHVVKSTWPVRPSYDPGSYEGFIRDDERGIVFVGEGCWGAPLRSNNDNKPWTRNSGSFNQFKWIFVDPNEIEVRTVKTDGADAVGEVQPGRIFEPPRGLVVWSPSNGDVVRIRPPGSGRNLESAPVTTSNQKVLISHLSATPNGQGVLVRWTTRNEHPATTFEVLRSVDGGQKFERIESRRGQGGTENAYVFFDAGSAPPTADRRYQLRCISPGGQPTVYKIELSVPSQPEIRAIHSVISPDPASGELSVPFVLQGTANITIRLIDPANTQVLRINFPRENPGRKAKTINMRRVPAGEYMVTVEADGRIIQQYQVRKPF